MTEALFQRDGERYEATELTRGPWDPGLQHGGAPAALLAGAVEQVPTPGPMRVARVAYDFLAPLEIRDYALETTVVRPGRRVQLVEATLRAGEREVVRARALRIRVHPGAVRPAPPAEGPPPPPEGIRPSARLPRAGLPSFVGEGMELRFVEGDFAQPGDAVVWLRLRHPVLPDQEPTPLQRAVAAADFGNGVGAVLDWDRYAFINPDLVVHLQREPEGAWVCLSAHSAIAPDGVGLASSALADRSGEVGRATQALIVAPATAPGC